MKKTQRKRIETKFNKIKDSHVMQSQLIGSYFLLFIFDVYRCNIYTVKHIRATNISLWYSALSVQYSLSIQMLLHFYQLSGHPNRAPFIQIVSKWIQTVILKGAKQSYIKFLSIRIFYGPTEDDNNIRSSSQIWSKVILNPVNIH